MVYQFYPILSVLDTSNVAIYSICLKLVIDTMTVIYSCQRIKIRDERERDQSCSHITKGGTAIDGILLRSAACSVHSLGKERIEAMQWLRNKFNVSLLKAMH